MTSLKLIIKSKLNKTKRQKHIAQMERELGLIPSVTIEDEYKPQVSLDEFKLSMKRGMIVPREAKAHYDPLTVKILRGKRLGREATYNAIEDLLHGYHFTDAGTAKDIHSKYRMYDGTIFLYWDKTEIDLMNCSFQFINECKEKLEWAGFKVNVLDMDRIKEMCRSMRFKSIDRGI